MVQINAIIILALNVFWCTLFKFGKGAGYHNKHQYMIFPTVGLSLLCHVLFLCRIKRLALDHDIDFTDHRYQLSLPIHARATASTAVKTNVKVTEAMTEPNLITGQQRVSNKHVIRKKKKTNKQKQKKKKKKSLNRLFQQVCRSIIR